jgi:DNA primase
MYNVKTSTPNERIHQNTIDRVINEIPITQIAESYKLDLKKHGAGFVTLCPFHDEKTPSFTLTDSKGFYCHGCNEGGGNVELFKKLSGIDNFREAVEGLAEIFNIPIEYENQQQHQKQIPATKPKLIVATFPNIPNRAEVRIKQVGNDITEVKTIYQYSESQWIERIERYDTNNNRIKFSIPGRDKLDDKHIFPLHTDNNGNIVNKKGDKPWGFYCQGEAIKYGKNKRVLMPEGESCVEALRAIGIVAISRVGIGKGEEAIKRNFTALKDAEVAEVVLIADNDDVGLKECNKFKAWALEVGLNASVIPTKNLWSAAPEKGDVVDFLKQYPNTTQAEFLNLLEGAIRDIQDTEKPLINTSKTNHQVSGNTTTKPEQKHKKSTEGEVREALKKVETILLDFNFDEISQEIKIDQIRQELGIDGKLWATLRAKVNKKIRGEQLESELRTLLLIDDKIKLTQGLHDLSEKYRMAVNLISNLLKDLKLRNTTQQFEAMGLDDFFDETSDAVDYLIPGLLPKGESALLVASPKVGKTLLGIDLAFAVATGEDYFLGEKTKTGRVLLVSVDESRQSTKAKLIKRGFQKRDTENIRIVTQFEVSQLEKLEAEIEDFRPTLVIIDSLKRITKGSAISENSAEFSDVVYTISELCTRYGASTVLIHHSKKDNETIGVDNVRGSSAIVGALGNVWIMNRVAKEDPNNKKKFIYDPKDTRRQLYCYSRDSEGKAFNLEFNPENNSWDVAGEVGISDAELDERKNNKNRILSIMGANLPHYPEGLKGSFILDCLELEEPGAVSKSSMYVELNRLVSAKVIGSKPSEDSRGSLYFLFGFGHTTKQTQTDTSVNDESYHKNGNIPSPPPLTHPEFNSTSETTINKEFELGYKENKVGYKLVTSDFCNQGDVTNGNPQCEGVSDIETELVTSFGYKGGGGCAPDFVTKTDEPKTYTTELTDVTTFSDRIPDPIENKTTDFDALDIGVVLIAEFKELHVITARRCQQWLTHRGEYVSRAALQNQEFKVPTIGEMVTAIQKVIVHKNSDVARLLKVTYENDPNSLFCQAIATDEKLKEIYNL